MHPHYDGFVVHVRVENGSIVYQIAKSSPRAPNKKAEEQFYFLADALRKKFEAENFLVMQHE